MAKITNFVTTNPAGPNERLKSLQLAVQQDEAGVLGYAEYTAAGAIAPGGVALLKTGAASAMTLAAPIAGSPALGGQDGYVLKIVALDAEAYVVTAPANAINGNKVTATFGGAVGDSIELVAFGGVWYTSGTALGVSLA